MSATDLGDWAVFTKAAAMVKLYKIVKLYFIILPKFYIYIYTDILNIFKFFY